MSSIIASAMVIISVSIPLKVIIVFCIFIFVIDSGPVVGQLLWLRGGGNLPRKGRSYVCSILRHLRVARTVGLYILR